MLEALRMSEVKKDIKQYFVPQLQIIFPVFKFDTDKR